MVLDLRKQNGSSPLTAVDETGEDLPPEDNNLDILALEFVDFDSSGNKRQAVGNFEIDITMPTYPFLNEFRQTNFHSVIGVIPAIDSNLDHEHTIIRSDSVMIAEISWGWCSPIWNLGNLLRMSDLTPNNTQQLTFKLKVIVRLVLRVGLIVSKTHGDVGNRNGAIYRSPGSFSAKFFNVE